MFLVRKVLARQVQLAFEEGCRAQGLLGPVLNVLFDEKRSQIIHDLLSGCWVGSRIRNLKFRELIGMFFGSAGSDFDALAHLINQLVRRAMGAFLRVETELVNHLLQSCPAENL